MKRAERYIRDISSGKVTSCEYVKLCINRHLSDLKKQSTKNYRYYFDPQEAQRAISFICLFRHTKGAKAGQPFDMQDFQAFLIYMIFGWRRKKNGTRRFKKIYIEIPRKNGKTELAAAIALYCFLADNEQGAEIYTAATTRDQAMIAFTAAKMMARKLRNDSDHIKKVVGIHKYNVHILEDGRRIEPVAAEYDTLDGLSPHCAIIDEYHAHKTSDLLEVIETGMGARTQPLLFIITTAGTNIESPCYHYRKVCIDILKGIKNDDAVFSIIYTLDEGDDFRQRKNWIKANPGYRTILNPDFLPEQILKAKNEGVIKEIQVKTKNFNIWSTTSLSFIKDSDWVASGTDWNPKALQGALAYGGLDLASNKDIAAFVLFFPGEDEEKNRCLCWFWCPEDTAQQRSKTDGVNYLQWAKDGYISLTPGNVIDEKAIIRDVTNACATYNVKQINYDRWNSTHVVVSLTDDGANMIGYGQGFASMSAPIKDLEKQILSQELDHGNNPVLRWMNSNVALKMDPAGNVKIDKSKSSEKVDGMVALVMGNAGHMNQQPDTNESNYNYYDLVVV